MTAGASPAHRQRRAMGAAFTAATACAIAFTVVYWWTDDTLLEGVFLGASFGLLAIGLVLWAHHLLPQGPYEEEYPELRSSAREEAEVLATMDRGGVGRRRLLLGALGLAGGSVIVGAASALRSLGPGPYSYSGTPWRGGRRMVTEDGVPIHAADVPTDSFVVVFPEGFTTSPVAPAVLIRLPSGLGPVSDGPDRFVCFSRVCTHAGCAVGQYNALTYELECPCHQSTFSVRRDGTPVSGPATRALPRLPLAVDADGTVRSVGDFSAFVGPTFWHHT